MCEPTTLISDHYAVISELSITKTKPPVKTISIRKIKDVTQEDLLSAFDASEINTEATLPEVCQQLNTQLQNILDNIAPEKQIKIPIRSCVPWFDEDIKNQRKIVRKREDVLKKFGEEQHLIAYKKERNRLNRLLRYKRTCAITTRINLAGKDTKALHKIIKSELGEEHWNHQCLLTYQTTSYPQSLLNSSTPKSPNSEMPRVTCRPEKFRQTLGSLSSPTLPKCQKMLLNP